VIPRGAAAKEAHGAAVDDFVRIETRRTMDLAAESQLGVFFRSNDSGFGLAQTCQHFLRVVADR
jgi:hypothetical protein